MAGGFQELISEQATCSFSGSFITPFSVRIFNSFAKKAGNSWFEIATSDFWLKRRLVVLSYSCLKMQVPYKLLGLPYGGFGEEREMSGELLRILKWKVTSSVVSES
jgi:hypothetical protein